MTGIVVNSLTNRLFERTALDWLLGIGYAYVFFKAGRWIGRILAVGVFALGLYLIER